MRAATAPSCTPLTPGGGDLVERLRPIATDAVLVNYLAGELAVPVATRVPHPRPPSFVRLILTGGAGRYDVALHRATVSLEAWAASVPEASDLARQVDALLYAAPGAVPGVYAVEPVGAVQSYPDADSGSERYTATYDVVTRLEPLP